MRIVYLHYLCEGDTALVHVEQFVRAARSAGHEIDVYAMNPAYASSSANEHRSFFSRIRDSLKKRVSKQLHEVKELAWNLAYIRRELRLLREAEPDVVLVRDKYLNVSSVFSAGHLGIPVVVESNSPWIESLLYYDEYLHLPWIPNWLERWKLRKADSVTVVSDALRRHFSNTYKINDEKCVVNPNGADIDVFGAELTPDPELSREFRSSTVVGFVGSFQAFHGVELTAKVVRAVARARPSARFLFVGGGSGVDRLRQLTNSLGSQVVFTGRVSHERVPGLVAVLDIGVLPETAFYCSPLKILEWMAAGKAVVAPRYSPLEEVINHDVHGLLFKPGDQAALKQVMLTLIDDPQKRHTLGKAAAARVKASLTWAHNAGRVITACNLASRQRPNK